MMISIELQSITWRVNRCTFTVSLGPTADTQRTISWGRLITCERWLLSDAALLLPWSRWRGRQRSRSRLMCSGGEVSHKAHLSTQVPGLLCHLVNSRVQWVTFLLPSSLRAEEGKQGHYLPFRDRGACTRGALTPPPPPPPPPNTWTNRNTSL